jgi:hypothetical protein
MMGLAFLAWFRHPLHECRPVVVMVPGRIAGHRQVVRVVLVKRVERWT